MATIAVDIDSTLYDFETPAREAFLKLAYERDDKTLFRGLYHPWTEFRSPADVCGPDVFADVIDMCHDEDAIMSQTPYTGAVETINALYDNGHSILYISNRATERTDTTAEWLKKWEFPLYINEDFRLEANGQGGALKGTAIKCLMGDKKPHLEHCQYIIDDRPKTLIEFVYDFKWRLNEYMADGRPGSPPSRGKRKGFALMFEHNRALTDIPDIYLAPTWAGLNFYLVGKGLLPEPAVEALSF